MRTPGARHQPGRVTGAPPGDPVLNVLAGDVTAGFNHVLHRAAVAGAQIEGLEPGACTRTRAAHQALQRQQMRRAQIGNMHVVANAGAVRCIEVIAEHLQARLGRVAAGAQAQRLEQHQRDQVRLRIMALAQFAFRVAAGGIEIAQRDGAQPIGFSIVGHGTLGHQLGHAVGIDRPLRMVFAHRQRNRIAIGAAG